MIAARCRRLVSGFVRALGWICFGIVRIEASGRHDGAAQFFWRDYEVGGLGLRRGTCPVIFGGRRHKTIAASDNRLQIVRLARVVAEGAANFADRRVDALVDVDENILAPERAGNLLAGYELPFIFDEKHQEL